MNSGMRDTGTDTSWAMLPPAAAWASTRLSRIFQSLAACAPDAAISASRTRPASSAAPRASASGVCSDPGGPWLVTSISTYQGWTSCIGSSCPGTPDRSRSMIGRPMSSNAETVSPRRLRIWPSRATAAAGVVDAYPRGLAGGRLGEQAQHRGRDDAERAFSADEHLLHVVAGVVLAQPSEAIPDAAVGQNHLQPEHEVAHVAVAQNLHAAGVGRDVAADLAGPFRAEAQREKAVGALGGVLDLLENDARLHRDRVVDRVDRPHLSHARGRDDDLAHVGVRHAAAGQPGVAALRDDADAGFGADADDSGDLRRRLRLQYERDAALPVVAEALAVGRHVERIVDGAGRPDGGLQAIDHVGRDGLGCAYAGHVGNPHWARGQHRSG